MTIASEIGHYSFITHCAVDAFISKAYHALNRLQECADKGGFITPATLEANQLHADALVLRDLADAMMKHRAALLANQPQPYQQAAE